MSTVAEGSSSENSMSRAASSPATREVEAEARSYRIRAEPFERSESVARDSSPFSPMRRIG